MSFDAISIMTDVSRNEMNKSNWIIKPVFF